MLEGLEISVIQLSEVLRENRIFRCDTQYFSKAALTTEALIKRGKWDDMIDVAQSIESFGAYALTNQFTYQEEGIPFLRCVNIKGGFADFGDVIYIDKEANKLLAKSEVKPGMVLLTMSGSVGNTTVALDTWKYPINSNQDIAKITPKAGVDEFYLTAFLRSRFGQIQMERVPVGSVQQHIFLWMIERLIISRLSQRLETEIGDLVRIAYKRESDSVVLGAQAEQTLLKALGLEDWQPPEPLTYTRRASEALAAGRIDSDFFAPARYAALEKLAETPYRLLRDICAPIRELFDPKDSKGFGEVRNFDVTDALKPSLDDSKEIVPVEELGSTKKRVQNGDVVISRLRSYLRQIAVVRTSDEVPSVGSSEFFVLRPHDDISPDLLIVFLRSAPVQTILKYCQEGNQHPRFGEGNLLEIPFPDLLLKHSKDITSHIQSAHAARQEAQSLLDRAKRAVEIAIEEGEPAALKYLQEFGV